MSIDLRQDSIPVMAVSLGWMRTELVLLDFQTDEQYWHGIDAMRDMENSHYIEPSIWSKDYGQKRTSAKGW